MATRTASTASKRNGMVGIMTDLGGDGGWLKTLRLEDYAPRRLRPESLQQALFPYHEAWG